MSENKIELFIQGEGVREVTLVRVPHDGIVRDILKSVSEQCGIEAREENINVLIEDNDDEIPLDATLKEAGIRHRHRVHLHRCRRVEVSVNFKSVTKPQSFSTGTTIAKIKRWADDVFGLKGIDATEHALQICGTNERPDLDVHVGSIVQYPQCQICFDLVPKKRVEG
jgi:hypothetical protein